MTEAAQKLRYRIGGMDCAACATKIENAVSRVPGVGGVEVSLPAASMTVTPNAPIQRDAVERQVRSLGYSIALARAQAASQADMATGHDHEAHEHGHDHTDLGSGPWWRGGKARLTLASAAALAAAYLLGLVVPSIGHAAFLLAMLVGLVPIARRAVTAAMTGTPFTIESLMTIAAVGAVFIGATEEAAAVVLLFLIGELLEGLAAGRARSSIQGLADLVPKVALVERNGTLEEMPVTEVPVGATVLVRPGDRIPSDGIIIEGQSAIEEAPVTGESVPRPKGTGDEVFAGTINGEMALRVRVTAAAADNTIARVVRLVEEAQERKAPTERFIDRFSRYYTPGVLVVGALAATVPPLAFGQPWGEWIYKGLAILLIGCPCALVISTPAAIASGLSAGARRGLLMKGGVVLETLRRVTAVALDKTGTLTEGKPEVTDIVAIDRPERDVLSLAAAIETGSNHPLALAILAKAKAERVPVPPATDLRSMPGKGLAGAVGGRQIRLMSPDAVKSGVSDALMERIAALNELGKTVSVLVVDANVAGLLAMRDEPRADAAAGLRRLEAQGIRTLMLTGDNERVGRAIASALGIEVRAGLLPEDKQQIVSEMQASGQVVAKVGDGINDAPALAAADIGIAMGGGTDVALETADAAILHGRVGDVSNMIALSRATMGNIWQNIAIALGLKAVFLVTTLLGITGLWPAILADTGATVLVTLNALRLLGWKGR